MNKLDIRARRNLGLGTSSITSFLKHYDIDNVRMSDAGQSGLGYIWGHDENGGHHSHMGSKDYSEGVEGDYILLGSRGYREACHLERVWPGLWIAQG